MLQENKERTHMITTIMQKVAQIEDLVGTSKHVKVCFMRDLGIDQVSIELKGFPPPFDALSFTVSYNYANFWLDHHIQYLEHGGIHQ